MYSQALSYLLYQEKCSTAEVILFLEKRKLLTLLPQIVKELTILQMQERESKLLIIETPFLLNEESIAKVRTITGAKIESETKLVLKKSLLSGFRAVYEGQSYDASAQRIISELTQVTQKI